MKSFVRLAMVSFFLCARVGATSAVSFSAASDDHQALLQADHALLQAFAKADKAALDQLLDKNFTWIDSNGKTLSRAAALKTPPSPANSNVDVQERIYGQAAVLRANSGRIQVLRIWAKRDTDWKVVLYQEVTLVEKSEPPAADGAGTTECENPCNTIPFQPETPAEKEAVASWQGVMRAMASKDPEAYAPLIGDEFTATDTHHDRAYTKTDRIAQLAKQKQTGAKSVPPPLVSARMFDFGETVMMIAREQRLNSKAYFNTRMWVKRAGRWQMLFSFNTRIE